MRAITRPVHSVHLVAMIRFKQLLESSHINHEAVLHIALEDAIVGHVDFCHRNDLDITGNAMLCAVIEIQFPIP